MIFLKINLSIFPFERYINDGGMLGKERTVAEDGKISNGSYGLLEQSARYRRDVPGG